MTHPAQEDDVKAILDALAKVEFFPRGVTSYDPGEWFDAMDPARIARLLARLEQAERDAGRYAWTLHHLGLIEAHALTWSPAVHKPLLAYVQDFIDAHIAAIASEAKT